MADRSHHRSARPPTRREPLGPGDSRANIDAPSRRNNTAEKKMASSSATHLPHKQTLAPNGSLGVRSSSPAAHSPSPSPRNGRVSTILEEDQRKAKRISEISNASTTASGSKRKSYVGRWQLGKTIGKGGCSTVRLVRHKDTGQIGAAKIISRKVAESVRAQSLANLAAMPDRSLQDLVAAGKALPPPPPGLLREIAIMKLLDHPNIVQLYDVWENHNDLYLIMEYVAGGELFHFVEERRGGLPDVETVFIFRQIVAAMLYCHRISIHHRDLKPENILIDRETREIKLVDFGMAALQPDGKKLTTACGSPHYAAPEVINSKPYDGAQADVWSCGVILYVMLTGMTPFNYDADRNLYVMYRAIANADYFMPKDIPLEAQDLLSKIFVADPKKRIKMDEVWDHPFLHMFDDHFDFGPRQAQKEIYVGPSPILEDWTVSREDQIDKEILRNMQTLWHSVPRSVIVKKLLSHEANQEKYFYAALLKHREENLENYTGGGDAMSYAGSDYQHNARDPRIHNSQQHSQSQYSILNDEHLRSSRTFGEPPSSASSYDPYRPSRYRMTPDGASYTKVTVHRRGESNGTRKAHMSHNLRHTHANRVEALRRGGRQPSSSTLSKTSLHRKSMSRSSLAQASMSRHSLSSSVWPSSPPVAMMPVRATSSHKRGVSFSHVRRSSTASALTRQETVKSVAPFTPELNNKAKFAQYLPSEGQRSPTARPENVVRSKKDRTSTTPGTRTRDGQSTTPGQFIKGDIRKASSELEKACDDAFFRTSMSSSEYTDRPAAYETPPSSVSNRDSANSNKRTTSARPLPALPVETPNTFIARTLEETRNKLAARIAAEGGTCDSAQFEEVLATLEKIMPGAKEEIESEARRITSAPTTAKHVDSKGFLPIISEERPSEGTQGQYDRTAQRYRSVTAPVHRETKQQQDPETVRMVPPSSPLAPTTRHKRSQEPDQYFAEANPQDTVYLSVPGPNLRPSRSKSDDHVMTLKKTVSQGSATGGDETLVKKKSSWFRRWKEPETHQRAGAAQAWEELDDRQVGKNRLIRDKLPAPLNICPMPEATAPKSSSSNEFSRSAEENKGFSKWFGKMRGSEKKDHDRLQAPTQTTQTISASPPSPLPPPTPTSGGDAQAGRSWFARFLRLRPEVRTLAFNTPRPRTRTELSRILSDWMRHGITDLVYYPNEHAFTGRVDKVNSLNIKPVSFRIELFVVLQNGKKAGMSLARCEQVKGAASSFRRIVEVLDSVCRERHLLVEDEAKWEELVAIVC